MIDKIRQYYNPTLKKVLTNVCEEDHRNYKKNQVKTVRVPSTAKAARGSSAPRVCSDVSLRWSSTLQFVYKASAEMPSIMDAVITRRLLLLLLPPPPLTQ